MITFLRAKTRGTENAEGVDEGRRRIIGMGAAAASLGLVGAAVGWRTVKWLTQKPLTENFVPGHEGEGYRKVIGIFSKGPLTYDEAVKHIHEQTGVEVRKHRFNVLDKLGLTSTKKFYNFQQMLLFLPARVDVEKHTINGVNAVGSVAYDTCRAVPQDGRIQALADYILTRCEIESSGRVDSAADAIALLSVWVMKNIKIDLKHGSITPVSTLSGHMDYFISAGASTTNSFSNGMLVLEKGGISIDYSNILSDLLNSMGIPSRALGITTLGLYKERGALKVGIFRHSMVQVFAENGTVYLDVTPKYPESSFGVYSLAITEKPEEYSMERLTSRYRRIEPFYNHITGAMPEELITEDLRSLLEKKPFDYMPDQSDLMNKYKVFVSIHGREYEIYYHNKYEEDGK